MSNRLTFSLASFLILMFAFVAMPAMAQETLTAAWTGDVNADGTADDAGWRVTVTYDAAPAAGALATVTVTGGTAATSDPADGDGTATSFVYPVTPSTAGENVDITVGTSRRIMLMNGVSLATTRLAQPKLKSITAPMHVNQFFNAVITFEMPADAVTGPPAVPEIGPSDGLRTGDITVANGEVLSLTGGPMVYTAVINPTSAGATPVVISLAAAFPHQAAAVSDDGTSSSVYDTTAPTRGTTANDGPDTLLVNNRKPAPPDNGQWGPDDFDFLFTLVDEADGSGVRASSITLADNQTPHVLSFSNLGRTTTANQYAATVSTLNVDIVAGTVVTVLATVSDNSGNEVTLPVGTITLAAKTMTITPPPADTTAPTVTIAMGTQTGRMLPITITVADETGLAAGAAIAASEVTVTGGTLGTLSSSNNVYSGTITINYDTTSVTVSVAAGAVMDTSNNPSAAASMTFTVTSTPAPPTPVDGQFTFPAESHTVIARGMTMAYGIPSGVTPMVWANMPDLEDLLYRGGTIALTTADANIDHDGDATTDMVKPGTRNLVITEVMWARNLAKVGADGELDHQWIEVYNNLKVPVTAKLSTKQGQPALGAGSGEILLDRLSNVVGARWQLSGVGQNGYDAGDDTAKTDFISMYRKERGKDGHVKGHWGQSTEVYLANHRGTPGAKKRSQVGTVTATSFNVGGLIFNEISNRSNADKAHEWIELRNKSGGNINPKNWQISIVTAVGSDTAFFTFPNNDNAVVGAGKVLLLVKTDPSGDPSHPLAAGWNVAKNAANQVNGVNSSSPRYLVANFAGDGLPDNGEFVLILRNHNNKRGTAEHLIDIAGYDTNLKVSANDAGYTNLWPLKGGVRDAQLGNNKLAVGEVHRRQKDNIWGTSSTNYGRNNGNHHDDTAWRNVGYTGVGYKRSAAVGNLNGGTPGYDNGASKSAGAAATDPVIISEIMYDTSRRLPQWIEIMNTSTTVGVNLTNWAIDVTNHAQNADGTDFDDAPLHTRIKFWEHDNPNNSFQLPPRQTMLIVSTGTRNDTTNLPNGRILNLRKGVGPKLLNPYGFYLRLVAKANDGNAANHQFGDTVGNLADPSGLPSRRSDAQSFADIMWEWPSGVTEDGDCVSIARKTSDKIMDSSGTMPGNWIRSDMDTRLNDTRPATHYGTAGDIGSPGHVIGGALPVSLSKFRPERLESGEIVVRWVTESETNNAGFNILRSETRDGEFTKLNIKLIAGQGTTSERTAYEFADTSAKPNVVYYYQIQDVSFDGDVTTLRITHLRGNVSADGKLTTTWGELKALQ